MPRGSIAIAALLATLPPLASAQKPAAGKVHRLEATPATVAYGYYWSEAKPVLRVASGDVVDVDTLITNTPAGLERAGVPPGKVEPALRAIVAEVAGDRRGPGGHILTGPIYVEGAEPGDVLQVDVLSVDLPIDYGYNGCSGFVRENCDKGTGLRIIPLDRKAMTATFAAGIVVPLRPFFGSMGVAPAASLGRVSSTPPGRHAGNIDNKELVAGTTLYIPVFAPGALFEVGDGHAAQGDGEVDQTAIETSMRGRLRLTVRKGMKLEWPRAETPTHFISMATDADLAVATRTAIQQMIDFLVERRGLTRHEAYQLTSIAGDVAITQLVDQTLGVHVKLPKSVFTSARAGAPVYEVYAVRYATAPGIPVSSLVAGADASRKIDIPFMIWVLKAAKRNVLVDAGSYHGPVFDRWKLADVVTPSVAVARAGVRAADVTDIIVTHIHWDHVGGLDLFPNARIWIQRDEFTHYVDEQGRPKDGAIGADDAALLARLQKEGRLAFVDGDAREIIPGIAVYTGGKHTYASQYVAARSAAGTVVLASDNIYLYENLEAHKPLGLTGDPEADLRVQERVLRLASNPRLIVPGHDPAVFERFAKPGSGVARIQ